jgi:hypothetical protein
MRTFHTLNRIASHAEQNRAQDQFSRLPPRQSVAVIALLSVFCWGAVISSVIAIADAL